MKCFIAVLMVLGSAMAEVSHHQGGASANNIQPIYADARDSFSAHPQPEIVTSSGAWDTPTTYTSQAYPSKFKKRLKQYLYYGRVMDTPDSRAQHMIQHATNRVSPKLVLL